MNVRSTRTPRNRRPVALVLATAAATGLLALLPQAATATGTTATTTASTVAAPVPERHRPASQLILMHYRGRAHQVPTRASFALLTCDPSGGTHPSARAACRRLKHVNGRIKRLNVHPNKICTMEYRPVTVRAYGHWRGRIVHDTKTFRNACAMKAATAQVFRFR